MLPVWSVWSNRSVGESENSGSTLLVVDGGGGKIAVASTVILRSDGPTVATVEVVCFPFLGLRAAWARRRKWSREKRKERSMSWKTVSRHATAKLLDC